MEANKRKIKKIILITLKLVNSLRDGQFYCSPRASENLDTPLAEDKQLLVPEVQDKQYRFRRFLGQN
jgi:hypothetical protein